MVSLLCMCIVENCTKCTLVKFQSVGYGFA